MSKINERLGQVLGEPVEARMKTSKCPFPYIFKAKILCFDRKRKVSPSETAWNLSRINRSRRKKGKILKFRSNCAKRLEPLRAYSERSWRNALWCHIHFELRLERKRRKKFKEKRLRILIKPSIRHLQKWNEFHSPPSSSHCFTHASCLKIFGKRDFL